MGTLGCINDMLQRDKENRELRKLSPPFNMAALFSHQIRSHLSPPTVLTVAVFPIGKSFNVNISQPYR